MCIKLRGACAHVSAASGLGIFIVGSHGRNGYLRKKIYESRRRVRACIYRCKYVGTGKIGVASFSTEVS